MSVARFRVALPILASVLCGCYGAKALRQPIAVDSTERNVRSLMEQQTMLDASVRKLQETVARQEEMLRALRADTQTRLQELNESIQALGNRVGDTLERRSIFPVPPGWAAEGQLVAPSEQRGDSAAPAAGALTPGQVKAIYDNAYLDLNRGNYSLALLGFRDYLSKSPDSELADNAQYWIGECYYAQRDFRKAIEEFSVVEQGHPKGDKVPAAMLKIAYSKLQLEDRAGARQELRDLIGRFPNSDEAAQARTKLSSLE